MIRSFRSTNHSRLTNVYKRIPNTIVRQLSSQDPTNETIDRKEEGDRIRLLYKRDEERNTLPKTSFLVSSVNSIYWIWYVVDFVPAINASPIESFHVNPTYAYGGLGLSILIQSAFALYPLSLVSKIGYRTTTPASERSDDGRGNTKSASPKGNDEILVWKHTLPFMRTSSEPLVFPVGGIGLDKTSESTRIILEDHGGNFANFEGFLGLQKEKEPKGNTGIAANLPLLLDIRKPSEVFDSESMVHMLLAAGSKPQNSRGSPKRRSSETSHEQHQTKYQPQRPPKYQKKKRNRGKKN